MSNTKIQVVYCLVLGSILGALYIGIFHGPTGG